MDFSAKLNLPYLLPNQAQKHVTMNETLRALDAVVQLSVISASETAPPDSPSEGDRYIPAADSSGTWTGHAHSIAAYQDGAWAFYAPQTGWLAWCEADATLMVFDGTEWGSASGADPDKLGINATADAYNRLVLQSAASLFSHEGQGHQLKINKAAEGETASLLFQSNWQGHAELGLSGSNDFMLKTSADGQSFGPTLLARADGSAVGIGTWSPTAKLHVDGPVRIGVVTASELPDPEQIGEGALIFLRRESGEFVLAFSDRVNWRSVSSADLI